MLACLAAGAVAADERALPTQRVPSDTADFALWPSAPPVERGRTSDGTFDAFSGRAERPVQYIAQHPNPTEPLGFEGARFSPGAPVDPGLNSGIFVDEPIEEFYDPLDPESPAPAVSSGEWIRNGCWYTQQSAVYMIRNVNIKNETRLATDLSSAILPAKLSHLDIAPEMGYQPGVRSTFGRFLGRDPRNRDHAVEFTFLGLTHWQDGASLTARDPGAIISNIDPTRSVPGYNGGNFQSYAQTSTFNSYELNYRINRRLSRDQLIYTRDSTWVRQCTRSMLPAIFAGLRVVSIAETLKYLGDSSTANATYDIATHNNLVGLQAGADWFYEHYEWRLGGRLKGGSLVNWSNQSSRVRILDDNGAPLVPNRDEFAELHNLAFVGEISFIGAYQFTPNFAFRSSFDLMWVTNLALAQNQITFSPSTPTQISSLHSLFYQGFSIGLELTR
ncbi:MAG TPA: hypothetical protein VJ733_06510 [Candidatus Binatia bacterium]|nr:hypothetical protein [Candidatus Binatia bacterium]